MPTPKVKIRKKPTNKRCEKGYPCKTTCISREKNCKEPLKGQAATLNLWLKHQEEMLEITNKKRAKVGLTPARMTEYGYITAERTKLPQSAKVEKEIAVPESKPVAVPQSEKIAPKNLPDPKSAIASSQADQLKRITERYNKDSTIPVLSEDDYLALNDAFFEDNAAFHRNPRGITKGLQKAKDDQAKRNTVIAHTRKQLVDEYNEKVAQGELRPPTRTERLIAKSKGHEDNASVQSARTLLAKMGVDYKNALLDSNGNVIADSTPTEFAKSAIARLKSGQILLNYKDGYRLSTSNKDDGMYSLSNPNVSVQQGGKVQKLTEAEAIAFLNTKSPIPVVSKEPQSLGGTFLSDNKRNAEGQEKMLADNAIARDYQFKFKAGDKVSVPMGPPGKEVIKNMMIKSSYIEDGKPRYSIYEPGKKDYVMWANESDISPRTSRTKAKPKTESKTAIAESSPIESVEKILSSGQKTGLPNGMKRKDGYLIVDRETKGEFQSATNPNDPYRQTRRLSNPDGSEWILFNDYGSRPKTVADAIALIKKNEDMDGLTTDPKDNIIAKTGDGYTVFSRYRDIPSLKNKSQQKSANQKKIDDAIAPLAELANLRTDNTPEQSALLPRDWSPTQSDKANIFYNAYKKEQGEPISAKEAASLFSIVSKDGKILSFGKSNPISSTHLVALKLAAKQYPDLLNTWGKGAKEYLSKREQATPQSQDKKETELSKSDIFAYLNKSQSISPINVRYAIEGALSRISDTRSASSLEMIKNNDAIADGETVITYIDGTKTNRRYGTSGYGFAVWDKSKGKARISEGNNAGKLTNKNWTYYRANDNSKSTIKTERLLQKIEEETNAIAVNSPDLGDKVKAILDQVRTLPNGTAIAENIISELAKEVTPKSAANQKKIDDAIAPLAELANLRTNDTPKQPAIATDWNSLAKAEKQKEEAEMRRLQGAPDGLSPIKQPIKGRSIIQIQKQLDQQKIGLTLKKHYNSYRLTDKEDVSIADFGRIDTAVEYLNDPTALHNRQKFLANTRGHEVSHFVRSYEDPRSTGRLTTPTKYTTSFPVYRQQSPFGMNQARVKMLAGQERIPRKEARVILSAIYNGKILKESYNSIAEKNEIPENLIQLIKIALKQHPDLASEYPESVNAIKN